MVQEISDKLWQAEARTAETKKFIRDIKRITRRRFTAEEKVRIVLGGWGGAGYGFRPLTSSTGPLGKLQRDGVHAERFFADQPQWDYLRGYLKDRPTQPWTLIKAS
ncbi:MAG: hypothetical protein FJZ93_08590 [Chloroflexi bacterium]|nr:hypothetical protein [Chloroflexota bacterium]